MQWEWLKRVLMAGILAAPALSAVASSKMSPSDLAPTVLPAERVRADSGPVPMFELILNCTPYCVVVDSTPHHASSELLSGFKLPGKKDFSGAVEKFNLALAAEPPHARVYRNLAMAHLGAGALEAALQAVNKAFEIHEYPEQSLRTRLRIFYAMKDHEAALDDIDAALAIVHQDANLFNQRAYVLAELGRYEEALQSAWDAVQLVTHSDGSWRGDILDTLGGIHCLSGDAENAAEAYHESWRTLLRLRARKFEEIAAYGYLDGAGGGLFKRPPDLALSNWIADGCPSVLTGNAAE